MDAWRLSMFWDVLPLGAAEADALPDGLTWPDAPEFVKAYDGSDAVWLIDVGGGVRRGVIMGCGVCGASSRPAGS